MSRVTHTGNRVTPNMFYQCWPIFLLDARPP